MLTPNTSNRQGGPFIYSNEGSQISDKNSLPNFSIIGSQKMLKVSSKFSHKKFSNKGSNSPKKSRYVSKSFSKLFILGNLTRGLISALVFHGQWRLSKIALFGYIQRATQHATEARHPDHQTHRISQKSKDEYREPLQGQNSTSINFPKIKDVKVSLFETTKNQKKNI